MTSRPILLGLDIDGVLNSSKLHAALTDDLVSDMAYNEILLARHYVNHIQPKKMLSDYVDRRLVDKLHELLESVDADIIGISSWFFHCDDWLPIAQLLGIKDRFIGISENTAGGVGRCETLAKYMLSEARYEHLIVLDDQAKGWDVTGLSAHHVRINGNVGLSDYDLFDALYRSTIPFDRQVVTNHIMNLKRKRNVDNPYSNTK